MAKRALKIGTVVLLLVAVVLGVLLYPYEIRGIPEWRLQVFDSAGKPLAGAPVSEEWLDPIDEGNSSGDQQMTDAAGLVQFPGRSLHNRLGLGLAGAKRSARVLVCAENEYGDVYWDGAGGPPATLRLRKGSCPYD